MSEVIVMCWKYVRVVGACPCSATMTSFNENAQAQLKRMTTTYDSMFNEPLLAIALKNIRVSGFGFSRSA